MWKVTAVLRHMSQQIINHVALGMERVYIIPNNSRMYASYM